MLKVLYFQAGQLPMRSEVGDIAGISLEFQKGVPHSHGSNEQHLLEECPGLYPLSFLCSPCTSPIISVSVLIMDIPLDLAQWALRSCNIELWPKERSDTCTTEV